VAGHTRRFSGQEGWTDESRTCRSSDTIAVAFSCLAQTLPAQTITTFDVPGAVSTFPRGINAAGEITGSYRDSNRSHGFIRDAAGTITPFDVEGSLGTFPTAISLTGTVIGDYAYQVSNNFRGFVRDADGTISTIVFPGSAWTRPLSINNRGEIAGLYCLRPEGPSECAWAGFVRDARGNMTHILPMVDRVSINAQGEVAGSYFDEEADRWRAFVRDARGHIDTFEVGTGDSGAIDIERDGTIVGYYQDPAPNPPPDTPWHAFIREADGGVIMFDAPDAIATTVVSMNLLGEVTGQYSRQGGGSQGFVRGINGVVTTFSVPGSTQTSPQDISATGDIVGYYSVGNVAYGFVRAKERRPR
jgi:hypothetical protein